jgi:hypothetical protein
MQFARKPGETVKKYIKRARKLHSMIGGGSKGELLKEMLAEKLLANWTTTMQHSPPETEHTRF